MSEKGTYQQSRAHGGSSKKDAPERKNRATVSTTKTGEKSGRSGSTKSGSTKNTSTKNGPTKGSQSAAKNAEGRKSARSDTYGSAGRTQSKSNSGQKDSGRRTVQSEKPLTEEQRMRNEIARKRRQRNYIRNRKLYTFVGYAAVSIAVISAVVIMSLTVLFHITDITISRQGDVQYSDEQIMMYCSVETGQNIFLAPMKETERAVTLNLPYIEECRMKIKLPSTVVMELTPAKAMGVAITSTGQRVVLSPSGRALEAVTGDQYVNAPELIGITVDVSQLGEKATVYTDMVHDDEQRAAAEEKFEKKLETAARIVEIMGEHGLGLRSITFLPDDTVTANYDDRLDLMLGAPTGLENKLELAATLISDGKIAKNEAGQIRLQIEGEAVFTPDYLLED